MPPKETGKKTSQEAATARGEKKKEVVQVGEKFSAFGEQLAIFLDEENSTNFLFWQNT